MKKLVLLLLLGAIAGCNPSTKFSLLDPATTGIDFNNEIVENDTFHIMNYEYIYNGGGVGIADLDKNGFPDIVFSGNRVSSRIYANQGEMKFNDVTDHFEGLTNDQWYSGIAIADVNGDGWDDVYLTSTFDKDSLKKKNRLWINQGAESGEFPMFIEQAEQYGVADMGNSVHAGFFDYDLDGHLDLYVLNNIVTKQIPTNYRAKLTDGSATNNDQLYHNNGDGTFSNVTIPAGITVEGYGLGLAFGDINKDGYPDIYVSNDYIANDLLYINQGDGTFVNSSKDYLSYQSKFSMGNDLSDVNNDGLPEIITLDMMPKEYFRKKQTINGNTYIFYVNDEKHGYEHQYIRNMLHLHNGFSGDEMLPFSEVGQYAGIYQSEWSWSPLFADYDNDGDKDLMVTNGFPKDLTDKDFTNYKAQMHGYLADDRQVMSKLPVVKVSNFAYEQTDGLKFEDRTENWGMKVPSFSYGAAFTDLDLDGDLDYVVNNINDPAFVYQNNSAQQTQNAYLGLTLEGEGSNTNAIGAKVEIWNDGNYQFHEHFMTRGYISSVDPTVHFGLRGASAVDSLRITWPSKRVTKAYDIAANQRYTFDESEAGAAESIDRSSSESLFSKTAGIEYTHEQKDYIDFFQNQNILPHKFSQIGPCMAKGDLDGDGQDDLLIGSTDVLPTRAFSRSGDSFLPIEIPGLTDTKTCTEADLLIFDIDGDGDNDVVAVSGGYANENPDDYQHTIYMNDNGTFSRMNMDIPAFPASVVRAQDIDQDGDLDLFVGARVEKGNFPRAAASFVLLNDAGTFTVLQDFDLGMVTDAAWTDVNSDGRPDLVVAREWASPTSLINDGNNGFTEQSLGDVKGAWSAVISGDFDGDGDQDIVLGNLGLNHRFTISEQFPMNLYAVDLDNNGTIDPLTTAYWPNVNGKMEEYPINYLDELAAQSPYFRKTFTSYAEFSYATVDALLNPDTVAAENRFVINNTTSYVLWNEESSYEWEPLPLEAQMAPIKKMLVYDFNGDGIDDVILGGNDHSYDVSTGNYSANKGLILLGASDQQVKILPPSQSGFVVEGPVQGLLLFEGDTSFVLTGVNRGPLSQFRLNRN